MPQEIRRSVCALDCPDTCSLLINVDENGRGSRLRGDPEHPVTRGFLCGKVARYLEREYHPSRLMHPLRRTGKKGDGQFEQISWDQALDTVAERLLAISQKHGSEAILPYSYAGTMGILNANGMDRRFFHAIGASRLDRTICSQAGGVGLMSALGMRYGTDTEDFRHSSLIIAWGANVLGTSVHLWPFIVEARRNGAKFYVIDPVQTRTAKAADKWFPIQPGSDLALALGMIHVILNEELWDKAFVGQFATGLEDLRTRAREYTPERVASLTGLPAEDIRALAREYAGTRAPAIRLNYGVQRTEHGADAVEAIALLPVLTGAMQAQGGGIQLSTSQAFALNTPALERPDLQLKSPLGREARLLNMSELGNVLLHQATPPVKALVVYSSNPAAVAPDSAAVHKGLRRDDLFTVVIEHFQTDTADFADIVLPTTTFLEHTDLYRAYGHYYLQFARPALPAPGETKPNTEIFRLLARRMGLTEPALFATEEEMIRDALASGHPFLEGITLERLEREGSVRLNLPTPFLPFADGPKGGKTKFDFAAIPAYQPPVESRLGDAELATRYPLELVSSKNDDAMNSTFGYRPDNIDPASTLFLHSDDAAMRGILHGDPVRIWNDRGSLLLRADVNGAVRPGVVRVPSVSSPKHMPGRQGINSLTSQRLTTRGGGATFFSCLVQVEKCGD
ncbi:MAG: molybdopterin-dependent oxidoreductase [Bryobacteraceae bacterium]|nr:molybdopterin-dependent oxidoreductase [Bryobacteraceae bacterium]